MDEVQNPHLPPAGCLCVWVMLEHIITNTLSICIQISLPVNCTDVESKHSSVLFSQYGLQSHHVIISPAPGIRGEGFEDICRLLHELAGFNQEWFLAHSPAE